MKSINAVPESISRDQYVSMMEAVGFRANEVKSVEFARDGVYVTAFATDADGQRIVDASPDSTGYAKHRIFVPVVDHPGEQRSSGHLHLHLTEGHTVDAAAVEAATRHVVGQHSQHGQHYTTKAVAV